MTNSKGSTTTTPHNDNNKIEAVLTTAQQEGEATIKQQLENVNAYSNILTIKATSIPKINLTHIGWTVTNKRYYHDHPDSTASGRNRINSTGGYATTVTNTYSGPLHVPNSSAITITKGTP